MSSLGLQKLFVGWMFVLTDETLVWFSFLFTFAAWAVMRPGRATAAVTFSGLALVIALPFLSGPSITGATAFAP